MSYASSTSVSPERSQEEIKRQLRRYGADRFGVMEERGSAAVMFEFNGLTIRIVVSLPAENDAEFSTTETGRERAPAAKAKAWEQAIRSRWRALLLAIRAKLEAVEVGISTIEREFMPFVVMPDGRTLDEHITPKLQQYAQSGEMPKLLGMSGGAQ